MANIKSNIKRNKQSEKRNKIQTSIKTEVKTAIKKAKTSKDKKDIAFATQLIQEANSKGVFHTNKAARLTSKVQSIK